MSEARWTERTWSFGQKEIYRGIGEQNYVAQYLVQLAKRPKHGVWRLQAYVGLTCCLCYRVFRLV